MLVLVVIACFIVGPILAMPVLGQSKAPGSWWAAYRDTLSDHNFYTTWLRTIEVALIATALAVSGATILAWIVTRTDVPARTLLSTLIVFPILSPVVVTAFGWATLGDPASGWLNELLHGVGLGASLNLYSIWGMGVVLGLTLLPIAYIVIRGPMTAGGSSLEEAALVAGASLWRVTRSITLPRIAPSIGAASLITFAISAGNFAVPSVLGFPVRLDVVSTKIYLAVNDYPPKYSTAGIYGSTLIVVLGLFVLGQQALERRSHVAAGSTTDRGTIVWRLGYWRWLAAAIVVIYFLVGFVMPLVSIALTTFLPYIGAPLDQLTLANYHTVFADPHFTDAVKNTLVLSTVGATIATAAGGILAHLASRVEIPSGRLLTNLASMPLGLPGIIIGVGFLWFFVGTPLYGTFLLIVIALVARFLAYSLRTMSAAQVTIHRSQEESARTCGAGEVRVFLKITMPLLWRVYLATWGLLVIFFTHEVDTTILLAGSRDILAVSILNSWRYGEIPPAAVGSVVLVAIGLLGVLPLIFQARALTSSAGTIEVDS